MKKQNKIGLYLILTIFLISILPLVSSCTSDEECSPDGCNDYFCSSQDLMCNYYDWYCDIGGTDECAYSSEPQLQQTCDEHYVCNADTQTCDYVTCYTDDDCPTDDWTGTGHCENYDTFNYSIWEDWQDNYCVDGGSGSSYCNSDLIWSLIDECPFSMPFCQQGGGNPECSAFPTPIVYVDYPPNSAVITEFTDIINYSLTYYYATPDLFCGHYTSCWYSLDEGITNSTIQPETNYPSPYYATDLIIQNPFMNVTFQEGYNDIRIWCNLVLNASQFDCSLTKTFSSDMIYPAYSNFFYDMEHILNASLISPANNSQTNGNVINYTANITCEGGCKNATLYFKNSSTTIYSIFSNITGTNQILLGNSIDLSIYGSDGNYLWYYDVYDVLGNMNVSDEKRIIIDVHSPTITWIDPFMTTLTDYITYPLNISIGNLNLNIVNLTIFNSTGNLIYNNFTGSINSSNFQISDVIPLDEGENTIGVYANDYALNTEYQYKTIIRDTTSPIISIIYPEAIIYSTAPTDFNYTYTETNCDSVWYSTDDGVTNSTNVSCGTLLEVTASEGSNIWTIYIRDLLGNEGSSSVIFTYTSIEELTYTSTPIYQTMASAGAGLGIFLRYVGIGIGGLLILLIFIAVISLIIYAIVGMIKSSIEFKDIIKGVEL